MTFSNNTPAVAKRRTKIELHEDLIHDYQDTAVDFLYNTPFGALFIDMGLGKTVISLTLIVKLLHEFSLKRVLILAPVRVANTTWPNEIDAWDHIAGHDYQRLTGSLEERELALARGLARKCQIFILNREQTEWITEKYKRKWPFDMVVIDESSSYKDHTTKRFKALSNIRPYLKRMVQLTATPAAETYAHLFAQIYLLDAGERFGKDFKVFEQKYFTYDRYNRFAKPKLRPGAEEEITKLISDICLVMKREDYLEFQHPIYHSVPVILSPRQLAMYKEMEKDFMVELDDGTEVEASTAAALSSKLLQMASGVLYDTVELEDATSGDIKQLKKVHQLHDHKIDELKRLVEEAQGSPILVSYHFKSSLDRLKKAFPKSVAMDKAGKCVATWNKGKIPMLLVHPQSAGHGLNLQKGGHHIVFFDIPWSLELYLQLIGRLDRQGQQNAVIINHLVAKGTLDELVIKSLNMKQDAQGKLLARITAIRNRIKRLKQRGELKKAIEAISDIDDEL